MRMPKKKRYVVALSFGNYLKKDGGTDKVMIEHAALLYRENVSYVQIAPVGKNADIHAVPCYTVVVDGTFEKVLDEYGIAGYFERLNKSEYVLDAIFIHHLKKFKMEFVYRVLDSTSAPVIIYIHDYYMICRQEQLLKNGTEYCGEEKPSEAKCVGCQYKQEGDRFRTDFRKKLVRLKHRLKIVAPSECALSIWSTAFPGFEGCSTVIPHQNQRGVYHNQNWKFDKLNIAYIGKYIPAKGSDEWKRLTDDISGQKLKYRCFYFGISDINIEDCRKVEVAVDKEHLDAMTAALRENNIQVVVIWSIWPETYSYTYYEALSANCFILTNSKSGNIRDEVRRTGNGKVFDTYEELESYIKDWDTVVSDVKSYWMNSSLQIVPSELMPNDRGVLQLLSGKAYNIKLTAKFNVAAFLKCKMIDKLYRLRNRRL